MREQIFHYVPPTVVQQRGGAKYAHEARMTSTVHDSIRTSDVFDEENLPTPPVSCVTDTGGQKHVQFDLSRNVKSSVSSTPARGDAPRSAAQLPYLDVSQIAELAPGNLQGENMTQFGNVMESSSFIRTIEEAAWELKKIKEVKIDKFKGGYSAGAAFKFNSWLKDVETCVREQGLSDTEAVKLVKDSTEDSAKSEVEFHLDTNPEATYNSLLTHLKTAFQTSETFETLIAQFYSKTQKVKEMFDEYGDEIQNLGRRIIAVNPEWRKEANAAMKHQLVTGMQDLVLQPLARTHLEEIVSEAISLGSGYGIPVSSQSTTISQETQTDSRDKTIRDIIKVLHTIRVMMSYQGLMARHGSILHATIVKTRAILPDCVQS